MPAIHRKMENRRTLEASQRLPRRCTSAYVGNQIKDRGRGRGSAPGKEAKRHCPSQVRHPWEGEDCRRFAVNKLRRKTGVHPRRRETNPGSAEDSSSSLPESVRSEELRGTREAPEAARSLALSFAHLPADRGTKSPSICLALGHQVAAGCNLRGMPRWECCMAFRAPREARERVLPS